MFRRRVIGLIGLAAACTALVALGSTPADAAPGDLDPSYGVGGSADVLGNVDFVDVAVQPDGKAVAVGATGDPGPLSQFLVARFSTDGSPDPSFGIDGLVTTTFGARQRSGAWSLAIQPDGRIVVAGEATFDNAMVAVARYLPNGDLDPTFHHDGKVLTDVSVGVDVARAVTLTPRGKIVVAGSGGHPGEENPSGDLLAVRYHPDGTLDRTLGGRGWVTHDVLGHGDRAAGVAVTSRGRILLSGEAETGGGVGFAFTRAVLMRLENDGRRDRGFSGDGAALFGPRSGLANFPTVAVGPSGSILVAARADDRPDGVVVRYARGGALDPAFGDGDGMADFNVTPGIDDLSDFALTSRGRIVAAGSANLVDGRGPLAVGRLLPDGSPDPTFGGDGYAVTGSDRIPRGVALQGDTRLLLAGSVFSPSAERGAFVMRVLLR